MAQFARPTADISRGSWTTQSGGTANLWASLDEETADDADFIQSSLTVNDSCEVRLSPVDAALIDRLHVLNYRARKNQAAGNTRGLTVSLVQGTTIIASQSHADLTALWPTVPLLLTKEQGASITDYTDLRVRFTATGTTGGQANRRRSVQVSWCQLRVPDVGDYLDDRITAWGVVVDTSVPGTVTCSLDGFTGTGPRLVDALRDLMTQWRNANPQDPLRDRRWQIAYYGGWKQVEYAALRNRIVTNPTPEDTGHYTQAEALARIDLKMGNFAAIVSAADAQEVP